MANAWADRQASNLRKRIPRINEEGWSAVRALRRLERSVLRGVHPVGSCCVRAVLRALRSNGPPRSHHYPDSAETRLLLSVALRVAVSLASFHGDACSSHWSGN